MGITIRKFIHIVKEENYGTFVNAFIVFSKYAVGHKTRIVGKEEVQRIAGGGNVEIVVTQYHYRLIVDLWLLVFDFSWLGRYGSR